MPPYSHHYPVYSKPNSHPNPVYHLTGTPRTHYRQRLSSDCSPHECERLKIELEDALTKISILEEKLASLQSNPNPVPHRPGYVAPHAHVSAVSGHPAPSIPYYPPWSFHHLPPVYHWGYPLHPATTAPTSEESTTSASPEESTTAAPAQEEETTTNSSTEEESTTTVLAEESTTEGTVEEPTTVSSAEGEESTTAASSEDESTTAASAEESTSAVSAEEESTTAASDESTTAASAEESTTDASSDEVVESTTVA